MFNLVWQFGETMEVAKKKISQQALDACSGSKQLAAASLGITEKTLTSYLAKEEVNDNARQQLFNQKTEDDCSVTASSKAGRKSRK